jgi:anti-sigma factor RsiW
MTGDGVAMTDGGAMTGDGVAVVSAGMTGDGVAMMSAGMTRQIFNESASGGVFRPADEIAQLRTKRFDLAVIQ